MKNFFTVTILSTAAIVNAQEVKFGKFSTAEITKEASKITADAPAEVLYSRVKYTVDWNNNNVLEKKAVIHKRIKVYDKDKVDNDVLSVEIPLGKSDSSADLEKLYSLKASTFNPENGKMVEVKLNKNDIFKKNIHKNLDTQTFTFPNVKNGSIIEYTYEIVSPFVNNVGTWYFQDEIPVVKSELVLETNELLKYSEDSRGPYKLNTTTSSRQEIQGNYSYTLSQKFITAENLPGYEGEEYVLNPRNLLSSSRFELASYVPRFGISQNFTTTWEKIGSDLYESEYFGRQLNGNGFLDDKVKELTAGKNTPEEKMAAIFNYVQTNFKWNEYNGIYTDRGIRKTFNEKEGNVADINLMLTSMLQKAGIDVNPVVLSTVQNGMINYVFPSKAKLNYVIVEAKINNAQYLMDATEVYSQINLLPMRALNHRGFSISKSGVKEINLVNVVMSNNKEQINATLTADGAISGSYSNYIDNYFYISNKHSLVDDPKGFEKEFVEDYNFEIENFRALDNNEGLIRNTFKFNNVQGDVIGNKIIVNPLLFTATEDHKLTQNTRNYNLEFGSPMTINKLVKIKIPEGYKVESLPQEIRETMINDTAGYLYKFEEKDGYITINSIRVLPYSILTSDYYPHFKKFMTKVVEAETQQIVLIKS